MTLQQLCEDIGRPMIRNLKFNSFKSSLSSRVESIEKRYLVEHIVQICCEFRHATFLSGWGQLVQLVPSERLRRSTTCLKSQRPQTSGAMPARIASRRKFYLNGNIVEI